MSTLLIALAITAGVIVLGVLAVFIGKKLGFNIYSISSTIIKFVESVLYSFNIMNDKIKDIVDLILQTLQYMSTIDSSLPIDDKVNEGMKEIILLGNDIGITFTDDELNVIKTVLTAAFNFLITINVVSPAVLEKSVIKYKLTK